MAKKKPQDKKLRREVEILKAQLKSQNANIQIEETTKIEVTSRKDTLKPINRPQSPSVAIVTAYDSKYLKTDLLKTFVLTVMAFSVLLALWLQV